MDAADSPAIDSPATKLPFDDFMHVVRCTPLISIDLIIGNGQGQFLLGLRNNEPAAGFWFVPGGRVRKDETLDQAFQRLTLDELGVTISRHQAQPYGVWEHQYPTNASRQPGFGTHYVVLAYRLTLPEIPAGLPQLQHARYQWLSPEQICPDLAIHANTRAYFQIPLPHQ